MTFVSVADRVRERSRARVETQLSLARYTTYRLGGSAALYVEPASADDLAVLGDVLREEGLGTDCGTPILILGRGSNVVVSDSGFPGLVIRFGTAFSWLKSRGSFGGVAGCSTSLPQLANWAARRSLTGIEFAVAIPGSVGGAVRMNAGAHGGAIGDRLASVTLFDLGDLNIHRRAASSLELGYRRSGLTESELVLDATFELEAGDEQAIRTAMDEYRRHRAATQPGAVQNAGSVFKNPPGDSAGRLIESAGLKGLRVGGASVSELHANFFMAGPGATAQDVFDLVQLVRVRVREASGIDLEPEIRFVGSFEARTAEALQ
jgi:UDP-N-acetylmuramate dehydrogenase